jgi:hypothetical protein
VISSSQKLETDTAPRAGTRPADPFHNPSYPERTHLLDRAQLEIALRSCDERVKSALQKLNALRSHEQKSLYVRLYHQMQGACDQAAEAARRIPLEAGELYHEDQERFQQAMDALDRVWQRWEKAIG